MKIKRDACKIRMSAILLCLIISVLAGSISVAEAELHRCGALVETTMPSWMLPSPPIPLERDDRQSCDNSAHLPPIGNQGIQGSCVAFASGYYYKTYQEWEEHQWDVTLTAHQFSPSFLYNLINGGADNGAYGSDAFKVLCDNGCATLADMPYNQYDYTSFPDEADFLAGIPYRSQQSYSIYVFNAGLTTTKNLLLNGHCAVLLIHVWSNFDNISEFNNTYCVSQVYGTNRGGHAVTLCGFDDNRATADGLGAFKVANSWGTGWGAAGYFWMSYQAVLSNTTSQGWVYYSTDKIGYSPTVLSHFHVTHSDRAAVRYFFGIGTDGFPQWIKDYFDFQIAVYSALPYPATNIVVDLTDGQSYLNPLVDNNVFICCYDSRLNSLTGSVTYFMAEQLTWPASAISTEVPLPIPDDGSLVYANLQIRGPTPPQFDVTLTPINPPITIPARGGQFSFNASVINHGPAGAFTIWARIKNPDGTYTNPTLGPITVNPPVNLTLSRLRTQTIPVSWPAGQYTYLGYANNTFVYPAVDSSSFAFTKSTTATGHPWLAEALCTGELFPGENITDAEIHPSSFILHPCFPNPFNPTTVIRYQMQDARYVSLKVYDTAGRLVSSLVDGWRGVGAYQVTFDGTNLASGVYLYTLTAGNYSATGKMVLMK